MATPPSPSLLGSHLSTARTLTSALPATSGPAWKWVNAALETAIIGEAFYQRNRTRHLWTLTINETDPLFKRLRETFTTNHQCDAHVETDTITNALRVYLNLSTTAIPLHIDGHKISAFVTSPTSMTRNGAGASTLILRGHGNHAREATLNHLDTLLSTSAAPSVFRSTSWNEWRYSAPVINRDLASVILPGTTATDLAADADTFFASEALYARLGMPWHRGYLFHGPPGTGKTSYVHALATHLQRDIRSLSLTGVENDSDLHEIIDEIRGHCILLIEDIDISHSSRERDDTSEGVTLAGVLNTLDGVTTPHGLLTIITTNNRDSLDPALLRAGRIDKTVEFPALTPETFTALIHTYLNTPIDTPATVTAGMTTADAMSIVKEALPDTGKALAALYAAAGVDSPGASGDGEA